MPRSSRAIAQSGHYHVVLRGNGRQILFESDRDRLKFLHMGKECFEGAGIRVLAWCLMDNHVHLLLDDENRRLSEAMHHLTTGYAMYFNASNGHVGHVFESRFKSFPIEDDLRLLRAVRYIHDNPAKAGLCPADQYEWSSYREYADMAAPDVPQMTATGPVWDLIGGATGFREFSRSDGFEGYEPPLRQRIPDARARETALAAVDNRDLGTLKGLQKHHRDQLLRKLSSAGLSVRQIERVTGIGRSTVSRAIA